MAAISVGAMSRRDGGGEARTRESAAIILIFAITHAARREFAYTHEYTVYMHRKYYLFYKHAYTYHARIAFA